MEQMFPHCAGLDVHKQTVVACVLVTGAEGKLQAVKRQFVTTLAGLEQLAAWLLSYGVTPVVMESTGVYWKPVYNVLAPQCEVWVVNAQHVKQVPGRKTDWNDAEWLARLMCYGLAGAQLHSGRRAARVARSDALSHAADGGTGGGGQPAGKDVGGRQHQADVGGVRYPGGVGAGDAGGVDQR
jgi:transposase